MQQRKPRRGIAVARHQEKPFGYRVPEKAERGSPTTRF